MTPEVRAVLLDVAHRRGVIPDHALAPAYRVLFTEMKAAARRHRDILTARAHSRTMHGDTPTQQADRRAVLNSIGPTGKPRRQSTNTTGDAS